MVIIWLMMMNNLVMVGGWVSTPVKKMKVKWDYCSQYDGKNKIDVPNHQPEYISFETEQMSAEWFWIGSMCPFKFLSNS